MIGGIIALLSAICFGFNNASVRRGVLKGTVLQALAITVPLGVPFFLVLVIVTGNISSLTGLQTETFLWLAAAGVVHFVMGRYCNYRSTKAIGGNLSGPWKQSNLILALVLAIIFLGEVLTPIKTAGILLIVAGAYFTSKATFAKKSPGSKPAATADLASAAAFSPSVASANAASMTVANATANSIAGSAASHVKQGSDSKPLSQSNDFEPNYAEGYTFALIAALAYGSSPILVRLGLENQSPGTSLVGALVSYMAAAIVIGLILCLPGKFKHAREIDPSVIKWFSLAAVLVATSQMLRYLALSMAPVSVVTPIQSTSAIFRVLFGWVINRNTEVFGAWVFIGVLVSMTGVVLLSLSTSVVAAYLTLPPVFIEWLSVSWPHR